MTVRRVHRPLSAMPMAGLATVLLMSVWTLLPPPLPPPLPSPLPPPSAWGAETVAQGPPEVSTPVFSLRRVPALVAERVAGVRLDQALSAAVASVGDNACVDVRSADGERLWSLRPDSALIPASTVKVLVARAVIDRLGPLAQLRTEVRSTPVLDGAVETAWMVGGGDPLLSTAEFAAEAGFGGQPRRATSIEALADMVVASGVRRIGTLAADDHRHQGPRFLPGWLATYASRLEITPLSALAVNKGLITDGRRVLAAAPSPTVHAAATLARLLAQRGVEVGAVAEGVAPAEASSVAAVTSPPVSAMAADMLVHSDNLAAELLVRELATTSGAAGSTEAGLAVVRSSLAASGVNTDGLVLADGSGLDRSDRASCRLLAETLVNTGADSILAGALPAAGEEGTLVSRLRGTPAQGRLRAKSGSLREVAGLTGWMAPAGEANGEPLAFAVLVNGVEAQAAAAVTDGIALAVATYPDAPAVRDLGPLTGATAGARAPTTSG